MVAEKPERPEQPGQPVPELPARPEAVAEVASRSEVAGWPSCCSEGVARRPDLSLIRMLSWDLSELSRGKEKILIPSSVVKKFAGHTGDMFIRNITFSSMM